jgi:hypothetical protein
LNKISAGSGSIYVNDILRATGTDTDTDGDNKTQVKLNYGFTTAIINLFAKR